MCIVIEAESILANAFAKGKKQITIRYLNGVRAKLETRVPGLYVDISMQSVMRAVNRRPDMFTWSGEDIARTPKAEPRLFTPDYANRCFNWRIPENIREVVIKAIK